MGIGVRLFRYGGDGIGTSLERTTDAASPHIVLHPAPPNAHHRNTSEFGIMAMLIDEYAVCYQVLVYA